MLLAAVALFALAALLPGLAAPAQAQTALPPSLVGERFFAQENPFSKSGEIDVSAACTAQPGETLTITYTASGLAVGPYPGTFTESGTVTSSLTPSAPGVATGPVITWTAELHDRLADLGRGPGDRDGDEDFARDFPFLRAVSESSER